MQEKADIRTKILRARNLQTKEEVMAKSEAICKRLKQLAEYKNTDTVYCYMDFKHEVVTKYIMEDARKAGKKIALPKVSGDEMDFYYVENDSDLQAGYCGILEPKTTTPAKDSGGMIIVPGVAFDERGFRVGYGKGFYDRFLQQHNLFRKTAFAFELQLVENIPNDRYDIAMDMIITEDRIIQIKQ